MNRSECCYRYGPFCPVVAETVYIAPGARIIGRVEIGDQSSIWYNAVIRGDVDYVKIGRYTNIQDGCILHEDEGYPLILGDRVTVGHRAVLHGCRIGDGAFIGMGAIVMTGALVGEGSVVGAGSLVKEGQVVPPGSLVVGSPARILRSLSKEEIEKFQAAAERYRKRSLFCLGLGESPDF